MTDPKTSLLEPPRITARSPRCSQRRRVYGHFIARLVLCVFASWANQNRAHAQAAPDGSAPATTEAAVQLSLPAAIRSTLRRHPALALARSTIATRRAELRAAGAAFDPVIRAALGHDRTQEYLLPAERAEERQTSVQTDATRLSVAATAGFTWGMKLMPTLALERVKQNYPASSAASPAQRGHAELALVQPLLRGRGRAGAASELDAAVHALAGAEHSAAHDAQAQVYDVTVAYFNFVAAHHDLELLQVSVVRAQRLREETKALVDAEHRTRADLRQVEASLQSQEGSSLQARNDLMQARYELALAMGLSGRTLPTWTPADDLPAIATLSDTQPEQTVEQALLARRDLRSAHELSIEAATLLAGAERNSLPQLDLGVSVGISGALDRDGVGPFFASLGRNVPGIDAGATLTLELPIHNDAALAARELRRASKQSADIARADVDRRIRTGVQSALSDLQLSAASLAAAARTLVIMQQLVVDERDKLREGLATLFDVVLIEERLTQAELTHNVRRLRYALARARLQYERGALPVVDSELAQTAEAILTSGGHDAGR